MSYINDFNQLFLIPNDNHLNSSYRPIKFQLDIDKCASFSYQQYISCYDGFLYDPTGAQTQDLPHERRTRLPLSQPDSIKISIFIYHMLCLDTYYFFQVRYISLDEFSFLLKSHNRIIVS